MERRTDREDATRKKERWKGRGYGMKKERGAELNQKDDDKREHRQEWRRRRGRDRCGQTADICPNFQQWTKIANQDSQRLSSTMT